MKNLSFNNEFHLHDNSVNFFCKDFALRVPYIEEAWETLKWPVSFDTQLIPL